MCVCLSARPACTPPLLAGVCGAGVGARARVLGVPRHSWFGRWSVWVFVRVPRLYPAIPGGLACVCVWVWVSSALRSFPGLGAGARGLLCAPRPFPVTFWGGCLWLGSVQKLPPVGFVHPPARWFFFFLFFFGLRGGDVWFSALSCRGFVVSVAGCPGVGSCGLCPPFPSC